LDDKINKSLELTAFQKQQSSLDKIFRSPAFEALGKQQSSFEKIFKSPAFEALGKQQSSFEKIFKSPAFEALGKQQSSFEKIFKSPAFEALQKQQNNMGNLHFIKKFDINTTKTIIGTLENVYEDIDNKDLNTLYLDNENREELKGFLFDFISFCKYFTQLFNTFDSKIAWDILTKISVIITLLSPIISNTDNNDINTININGNNNKIYINTNGKNSIIINETNKNNEVIIKPSVEEKKEKIRDIDISAGERT
jgi:hypothetical protein